MDSSSEDATGAGRTLVRAYHGKPGVVLSVMVTAFAVGHLGRPAHDRSLYLDKVAKKGGSVHAWVLNDRQQVYNKQTKPTLGRSSEIVCLHLELHR